MMFSFQGLLTASKLELVIKYLVCHLLSPTLVGHYVAAISASLPSLIRSVSCVRVLHLIETLGWETGEVAWLEEDSREGKAETLYNGTRLTYAAFLLFVHNRVLLINVSFIVHVHTAMSRCLPRHKRTLISDPVCTYELLESHYRNDLFAHFRSSGGGSTYFCLLYLCVSP